MAEGFLHTDDLPELLQQDIRSSIGFTQSQEELNLREGITDTWLVLSKQITEQDNITTERFWLYGINSDQYALILQFIVRGQGGQLSLMPGLFVEAELVFFPSVAPLRALMKKQLSTASFKSFSKFKNWLQVAEAETKYNSLLPLGAERAFVLQQLKPVQIENRWWLKEDEGAVMLIAETAFSDSITTKTNFKGLLKKCLKILKCIPQYYIASCPGIYHFVQPRKVLKKEQKLTRLSPLSCHFY